MIRAQTIIILPSPPLGPTTVYPSLNGPNISHEDGKTSPWKKISEFFKSLFERSASQKPLKSSSLSQSEKISSTPSPNPSIEVVRKAFLRRISQETKEVIHIASSLPFPLFWNVIQEDANYYQYDANTILVGCFANPSFVEKFQKKSGFHPIHNLRSHLLIKNMAKALFAIDHQKRSVFHELKNTQDWEAFLEDLSKNPGKIQDHTQWALIAQQVTVNLKRS